MVFRHGSNKASRYNNSSKAFPNNDSSTAIHNRLFHNTCRRLYLNNTRRSSINTSINNSNMDTIGPHPPIPIRINPNLSTIPCLLPIQFLTNRKACLPLHWHLHDLAHRILPTQAQEGDRLVEPRYKDPSVVSMAILSLNNTR
jgi:hypothetical protein